MSLSTLRLGFAPTPAAYQPAWELQRSLHEQVAADPSRATIIVLEHEPTYTAGRRTRPSDRPTDGTPVIDVDRGGLITWHGPGQLVAYPIVPLADPVAVKAYVSRLESAIIDTVALFGVEATRVHGRAGVWVLTPGEQDRKIAAIGIHVDQGVSMHGLALNVDNDLAPYDVIVPCGISDAGVTTLAAETGREITAEEVAPVLLERLHHHLADALVAEARPRPEDTEAASAAPSPAPTAGAAGAVGATTAPATAQDVPAAPGPTASGTEHAPNAQPTPSAKQDVAKQDPTKAPSPGGRRLLRVEARNAAVPVDRKPEWIRAEVKIGPEYVGLKSLVKDKGLHTVCEEAGCPNIFECWEDREATFLIGGSACTRRCDFCQIDTGKPSLVDKLEPTKVARSIQQMQLRYATVTGVARDDLEDEGTWLYAETVRKIHEFNPGTGVELLIPDFSGKPELLDVITESRPEVYAHNVETVPRLFKRIRPAFRYERSLATISHGRDAGLITKSNLILGMGEERSEITQALKDLRDAGTDIITLTQYLRPTERHLPVDRWVRPEEFVELSQEAEEMGYLGVMAGPLVRSSYRAGRLWARAMRSHGRTIPEELSHIEDSGTTRQEAATLLTARVGA